MSALSRLTTVHAPALSATGLLLRAVRLHVWSGLVAWRWILLVLVFAVTALVVQDTLAFHFAEDKVGRRVDAWDLFPTMLFHTFSLHFLFGFGFLLLIGDSFLREREEGTAALIAVRVPSRALYWFGKMGAVGVIAVLFVVLGLATSLLVGFAFVPPSSAWPALGRPSLANMYPPLDLSLPVYNLLLAAYTASALWVIGCITLLLSMLVRHKVVLLATIALWTVLSLPFFQFYHSGWLIRLLQLGYFISSRKHYDDAPMSLATFFTAGAAVLVVTAVAGAWRLQKEEL
jgi:hypothetical protein